MHIFKRKWDRTNEKKNTRIKIVSGNFPESCCEKKPKSWSRYCFVDEEKGPGEPGYCLWWPAGQTLGLESSSPPINPLASTGHLAGVVRWVHGIKRVGTIFLFMWGRAREPKDSHTFLLQSNPGLFCSRNGISLCTVRGWTDATNGLSKKINFLAQLSTRNIRAGHTIKQNFLIHGFHPI